MASRPRSRPSPGVGGLWPGGDPDRAGPQVPGRARPGRALRGPALAITLPAAEPGGPRPLPRGASSPCSTAEARGWRLGVSSACISRPPSWPTTPDSPWHADSGRRWTARSWSTSGASRKKSSSCCKSLPGWFGRSKTVAGGGRRGPGVGRPRGPERTPWVGGSQPLHRLSVSPRPERFGFAG
jgi:hypothetical protein